ncbi:hypothetical protein [Streptomyces sp. NPDC093568]|uniref:hypothetical protein n=1 Tax=Streptomyces sp. NPDC093568 TaxID=3366041 RepID=UPI00382792EF
MKGRPLIDPTSLFSALEGQPRRSAAVSPPPTIKPFQAPDFGEDETLWPEEAQEAQEAQEPREVQKPAPRPRATRPRAA